MKALGLALIAVLAIGCSSTPTSPSPSVATSPVIAQAAQPGEHIPGDRKVTIHFYSDDIGYSARTHVTGMPVTLTSVPASTTYTGETGRQGSISIDVPKTSTAVTWTVLPNADGWCAASGTLNLPYDVKDNWFAVHKHDSCIVNP